jgi:regulator of cell morphogenesis and NO signaling
MSLRHNARLADVVTYRPGAIPLLEELGVDYFSAGGETLGEVAVRLGVEPRLLADLLGARGEPSRVRAAEVGSVLAELRDVRHPAARGTLVRLERLFATMPQVEQAMLGGEWRDIAAGFESVASGLVAHCEAEEMLLFPEIEALDRAWRSGAAPAPVGLEGSIDWMMIEHASLTDALRQLAEETSEMMAPSQVGPAWRSVTRLLGVLQREFHEMVHLENNVLFPGCFALSSQLSLRSRSGGALHRTTIRSPEPTT